jgi:hypothetical protein
LDWIDSYHKNGCDIRILSLHAESPCFFVCCVREMSILSALQHMWGGSDPAMATATPMNSPVGAAAAAASAVDSKKECEPIPPVPQVAHVPLPPQIIMLPIAHAHSHAHPHAQQQQQQQQQQRHANRGIPFGDSSSVRTIPFGEFAQNHSLPPTPAPHSAASGSGPTPPAAIVHPFLFPIPMDHGTTGLHQHCVSLQAELSRTITAKYQLQILTQNLFAEQQRLKDALALMRVQKQKTKEETAKLTEDLKETRDSLSRAISSCSQKGLNLVSGFPSIHQIQTEFSRLMINDRGTIVDNLLLKSDTLAIEKLNDLIKICAEESQRRLANMFQRVYSSARDLISTDFDDCDSSSETENVSTEDEGVKKPKRPSTPFPFPILSSVDSGTAASAPDAKGSSTSVADTSGNPLLPQPLIQEYLNFDESFSPSIDAIHTWLRNHLNLEQKHELLKSEDVGQLLEKAKLLPIPASVDKDIRKFCQNIFRLSFICLLSVPRLFFVWFDKFDSNHCIQAWGSTTGTLAIKSVTYPALCIIKSNEYQVLVKSEVLT